MLNVYKLIPLLALSGLMNAGCTEKADTAAEKKTADIALDETVIDTAITPVDAYPARQVAENTWVIHGPLEMPNPENQGFMNNPAFIITEKSVIVFDPGASHQIGEGVLKQIRSQTENPVTHIFISHVHGDHWLGNAAFKNAFPDVKIYAHPEMIRMANAGEAESWVSLMETMTEGATAGTLAVIPALALKDGQEIIVDNMTIRAHLNDWAHTKTDAMFVAVEEKVLFTGDNVTNGRIARMNDGSFRGNRDVVAAAMSYPVDIVVPGHGETGDKTVLEQFHTYINTVYSEAERLMDEGMDPFEMKAIIAGKVVAFKGWGGFDDELGKHISLAALEAEQAAFE